MKKFVLVPLMILILHLQVIAQEIDNFQLPDISSGGTFTLRNHLNAPAVVLIFVSNSCPFARLYEDRIKALKNEFSRQGVVFALVNPLYDSSDKESEVSVKEKINDKGFDFPYLDDSNLTLTKALNAVKLPEAFVLTSSPTGFAVAYHGAIDNNAQVPQSATKAYLKIALGQVLLGANPMPTTVRPVGCNIQSVK